MPPFRPRRRLPARRLSARARQAASRRQIGKISRLKRLLWTILYFIALPLFAYGAYHASRLHSSGYIATYWNDARARILGVSAEHGFTLEHVQVKGRVHTPLAAILGTGNFRTGAPLYAYDLPALQERLHTLPWVRAARVERRLPDTLFIQIQERVPFALWQQGHALSVIDADGTVITAADPADFGDLMMVVGEGANHEANNLFVMLNAMPDVQKRVVAAIRIGQRRWNLLMDNGVFVNLPEENPHKAYAELVKLFKDHQILDKNIRVLDMRLPDRLILEMMDTPSASTEGLSPPSAPADAGDAGT